jgi:superfamily II DNA or RNA helicase/HKD family nuclease
MSYQKSQSTFITNNETKLLKERISSIIGFSKELKFLVGFFYYSGIRELYDAIRNNPNLKLYVLTGLNVDKTIHGMVEYGEPGNLTGSKHQDQFLQSVVKSVNTDEFDTPDFYEQAKFFIQAIIDDKLIIRKTREPNHAKLYFFKIRDDLSQLKKSCFITGSSNLTRAGLAGQNEFNVEISDYGTEEAEQYFDALWEKAVRITEDDVFKRRLINVLTTNTLLAEPTPYEAFALVLKTYIDVQKPKNLKEYVFKLLEEKGYRRYTYQVDAVAQALSIIEQNGGVILSDVVGLGKSIIAGMVAKCLGKRGIIICPPGLIGGVDYKGNRTGWERYKHDFELNFWDISSLGLESLRTTLKLVQKDKDYEVIIVDEAHRFRNQDTEAYEILSNICRDKIVILLTATPFNNTPADIFSLLKLFLVPGKSNITLPDNLDDRFRHYNQIFKRLSNIKKNYRSPDRKKKESALNDYKALFGSDKIDLNKVVERSKYLSKDIRTIISQVTIRRNRIDLKTDPEYSKEIYELPEVQDPREAFFALTPEQSEFYDKVIGEFFGEGGLFSGAIYRPFVYEAGKTDLPEEKLGEEENREALIQKNLYDFMRRLLVKRFESSFGAFEQSIKNFKSITEKVQKFIDNSGGKFILDRRMIDRIYECDEDEIEEELGEFELRLTSGNYPKHYKVYNVYGFAEKDKFLADIEADLRLFEHILEELGRLKLVDNDPKLARLSADLAQIMNKKDRSTEPARKVVIFSEYIDTVQYVESYLHKQFDGQLISVRGDFTKKKATEILSNFDTTYRDKSDKYKILITTDKMSEGFNLNRAGAVINIDIPWNPTRVIQRVGRTNRISEKVFDKLYIYNFFPTVQGAEYVKSRQIASQKMFMIHNTLGEDAKIFEPDEEPTAAKLFEKIQENPDNLEHESFQTSIRRIYAEIDEDVKQKIKSLPSRIKVAKKYDQYVLTVFIKKGAGLFIRNMHETDKEPNEILFEEALPFIQCQKDEPALPLSQIFWDNYLRIRELREKTIIPSSELSLEKKAFNNLKTLLNDKSGNYGEFNTLLLDLIEDIAEYKTLSDYTLRRITNLETTAKDEKKIAKVKEELANLRLELGEDYLDKVKQRIGRLDKEVIIAIENIKV